MVPIAAAVTSPNAPSAPAAPPVPAAMADRLSFNFWIIFLKEIRRWCVQFIENSPAIRNTG
jgi:hypothetical protein